MLSVLQATAWYAPFSVGGTENYLSGLVHALRAHGINSRIIAPLGDRAREGYEHDGIAVRTYEVDAAPSLRELRGEMPDGGLQRFREMLAEERPDIYHQHSWTRGLGAWHLRAAREAGCKTVLTVHTPNNLCLRGTMMRFGAQPCDGLIDPPICASCWSHARGAPQPVADLLGALPAGVSAALETALPRSRLMTALSARALAERRRREFASAITDADRIVAVSQWLFNALTLNGVPPHKLVLSRQGVDPDFFTAAKQATDAPGAPAGPFRLLYLGRWHPLKGLHVLVRAVRALSDETPVSLSIHGIGDGAEEQRYAAKVRRLIAGDRRIVIAQAVPPHQLAATLARADALAVPSLALETGPLVVLEAKAVGLPVIGSRLGGIAELVRDPEDGILVAPGDIEAWSAAISGYAQSSVRRITKNGSARQTRSMSDAAADMAALYRALREP